jgi:hypothetical protein
VAADLKAIVKETGWLGVSLQTSVQKVESSEHVDEVTVKDR